MGNNVQIRIESMENGGWVVQKIDPSASPVKVLSKKYVTATDVAGLFFKTTTFDTGFLDKRIVRYARSAEHDIWTLIVPGAVRPIICFPDDEDEEDTKTVATWMPPSLWIIKTPVGATKKWDARICLVDPESGAVGPYPSPNVYVDGRICWGTVRDTKPPMTFPRDCDKVLNIFFGSEFNNDLWNHSIPFGKLAKTMSTKKVTEDMTDRERMKKLLETLPELKMESNVEKFYKSVVRSNDNDEPNF